MGTINWLAVVLSANLAVAIGLVWYGPLFGGAALFGRVTGDEQGPAHKSPVGGMLGAIVLQAISALMLAHAFARIGSDTLAVKPWLYWMQSGGVALAFVGPAIFISYARHRMPLREALVDAGFWLAVYIASGTVFWLLA
ncbi:DUF1761 domain-containing protein [Novosphingobium sp. TH158]|uniref:DUF1761 domain-containing protein n=1 Tax=Novosphingobium sp. TH158 TaxID=2067455 RepID=UPI000C7D30EF|nr:DUF1761 domain-containing protein [Novosphingobium sp. TH158]PLK24337.1 DUF1761 domain-containing protein [Novosphingobium sp. TH158]